MFRKIAIAAGLSTASLVAFPPAASAQSVTFSIGSGGYGYNGYGYNGYGYNSYGYANSYPGYAYTYSNPQYYGSYPAYGYNGYNAYNSYNSRAYEWAQRRYAEQLERWQRERAREEYRGRDHWDNGDDDDGD
jgi:hypothetical protein